jgi:putative ABC transport system permease protein
VTSRFLELFWREIGRSALRRPGLSCLNIASIALGVSVFLAVEIANRGALESFRGAVELTAGRTDLEVRGRLDERLLPRVAGVDGVRVAAPLVEGIVALESPRGEYLRIVGVDPFVGSELLGFQLAGGEGEAPDLELWMREPGIVAVSREQAARMRGWAPQGTVDVDGANGLRAITPVFTISSEEALAGAEPRLAAMDIGWAQEMLGLGGFLTAIQLGLEEGADVDAVTAAVRAVVPPDAAVAPPASRSSELDTMLGAFQLNLTAMSLVSVVVGMFLIFNSVASSVVKRQPRIAILRACGVTRTETRALFLGEAASEALLGAMVGVAVAPLLAGLVANPLSEAVSALYQVVSINKLPVGLREVILGLGVGVGAAVVAAWFPASEAARMQPARILHPGAASELFAPRTKARAGGAVLLFLLAILSGWSAVSGGPEVLGFVSAGAVIAGFTLLVPWFASLVAAPGRSLGLSSRMASDHLVRSLHRNGVTIAALAAAVSMSVAVVVMIHSFRQSLERWVDRTLEADLFIAPAGNEIGGGLNAFLPEDAATWSANRGDVARLGTFRELQIPILGESASLAVVDGRARGELEFLDAWQTDPAQRVEAGASVAISESFANRFGLTAPPPDGKIDIPTPTGTLRVPLAGIYRDYTRDRGTIFMARSLFDQHWQDPRLHSLAITLAPGANPETFANALRGAFGDKGELAIYDNASLRGRIFEIFDRAFAVTSGLRVIAILVAVVGVAFSLNILASERAREMGVLRSIGASQKQIFSIYLFEAGLVGASSSLVGLLSGAVLAMVLTWVVNKAFFGWSIALSYPPIPLLTTPLWVVAIAIAAALLPALLASKSSPAATVRFE